VLNRLWSLRRALERLGLPEIQDENGGGQHLATLVGHTGTVLGAALSNGGQLLASGGTDQSVQLWDACTRQNLAIPRGQTGTVTRVALSTDDEVLTSSTEDGTVHLWDVRSGRPIATLLGHTVAVVSVGLSAGPHLLASGSFDRAVKIWSTDTGALWATLRAERYKRLDITGLTGLTDAQRLALIAVGAVEQRR
jgi:WD40 repeat protein